MILKWKKEKKWKIQSKPISHIEKAQEFLTRIFQLMINDPNYSGWSNHASSILLFFFFLPILLPINFFWNTWRSNEMSWPLEISSNWRLLQSWQKRDIFSFSDCLAISSDSSSVFPWMYRGWFSLGRKHSSNSHIIQLIKSASGTILDWFLFRSGSLAQEEGRKNLINSQP